MISRNAFPLTFPLLWSLLSIFLAGSAPARADVKLPGLFSDHMVMQRNMPVPVWGWADEGERVTVEFRGHKVSTRAKHGVWRVTLGKLSAGGPDELKVTGKNTVTVRDVLVGEVWIASGQSNMEWPLRLSFEPQGDIQNAANPRLRLFTVPKLKATEPVGDVAAAWQESSPESVSNFCAVAYYFGSYLQRDLDVPVGMIHTSWGGSPAEVWIRHEVLAKNPEYKRDILDAFDTQERKVAEAMTLFEQEQAQAKQEGKPFDKRRPSVGWRPSELYNGMIAPLLPYAIQGAIWYQGESNASRAYQYRTLFTDMIRNWRKDWDQGDFTFLEVQLAPFMATKEEPAESAWAELREAQLLATEKLPKVGMAVITDVGDQKDIHPRWKKPVGYRLSLAARAISYEQDIVFTGPSFRSMKVKHDQAFLSFDSVGKGLVGLPGAGGPADKDRTSAGELNYNATSGHLQAPLQGFTVAGEDRKFYWAQANILGDKVVVSSPQVAKPVAMRYGWADYPVVNLYCSPGPAEQLLPASPFRTDDWPISTAPKSAQGK
jgi:sialate O-acetylesterase